ncbi:hypothetical protein Q7P37_011503 [Cladosporium fusiforme]
MSNKSKNITDFFRPFTIPKERIPRQDEDDEIIVASSTQPTPTHNRRPAKPSLSPRKSQDNAEPPKKRGRGRPRKSDTSSPSKLRLKTSSILDQSKSRSSTPTRRSPRKNKQGLDGADDAPPISSGLTTLPSSSQASPTKLRTLDAVDIPSPARELDHMPVTTQLPRLGPKSSVNASFSSFSTLTSISGISSQSSSRRIVRNGVAAVTNSDSASMSSSSSDDELADFESFVPRKKQKVTPPRDEKAQVSQKASTAKSTRSSTRLDKQNPIARKKDSWKPPSPPPTTSYKHSLLNIAKRHAQEAASERNIAEAEAEVEKAERSREAEDVRGMEASESKHMAATLAQDSDEEERMLMAIDRTEALRAKETFCFFRGQPGDRMEVEFPFEVLDSHGLTCLRDPANRERACTSGFLAVMASQKGLPDPIITWIQGRIFEETSEELCESYVGILNALVKNGHTLPDLAFSLSEIYVGQTFRDVEEPPKGQGDAPFPPNIKYALKAMAALAPEVSPVHQACALAELVLFNNDDDVRSDIAMQLHIEQAMNGILESNDENSLQTVFQETTRQIMHASTISRHILSRAVATLPATTLRLHSLRRRLALHILLEAPLDETINTSSSSTGARLLTKLKTHPSFHISESTDYVALHSLIDLLDIAIDAGFSTFTFLLAQNQPTEIKPQPKNLFTTAQAPQAKEVASFNAQTDALTTQLRLMGSKIRDAGTSHLKRTEAKSALERLVVRLECAVRTRPRPRKGVFDRGGVGNVSAAAMQAFLKKNSVEEDADGGGDDDEAGGRRVEDRETKSGGEALPDRRGFQRRPGTQHKVTWKDEVVSGDDGDADAETKAGAEVGEGDVGRCNIS